MRLISGEREVGVILAEEVKVAIGEIRDIDMRLADAADFLDALDLH